MQNIYNNNEILPLNTVFNTPFCNWTVMLNARLVYIHCDFLWIYFLVLKKIKCIVLLIPFNPLSIYRDKYNRLYCINFKSNDKVDALI